MEKSRLISILAVGLLISNMVLVGFILVGRSRQSQQHGPMGPPPPPGQRGPRNIIIDRLHFTDAQVAGYDKLIVWHRGEIEKADRQIMELKNQLYGSLATPQAPAQKDSLITAISTAQQNIERIHYKHFEDIRGLCTEQQKPEFEALTKEIASLFAPHPHIHP